MQLSNKAESIMTISLSIPLSYLYSSDPQNQ